MPPTHRFNIDLQKLRATIREVEHLIRHPDTKEATNIDQLIVIMTRHNNVIHYLNLELQ